MGHGSGHGSAPGSAHDSAQGSVPFQDDEDDSPVEEVSPVKPKKPLRRVAKGKKDEPKEVKKTPKEWTVEEEIALCQGWYDVSENSISGNSMKAKGFLEAVIRYFENETGSTRANHESGTNDLDVYQKACAEYKMMYKGDFTLEHCYNILKDHPGWKNHFYQSQGRKKSKTSETTSGSASGSLNLNEEADKDVEETQEFQPMGRDQAKAKKKAVGSPRGGASSFVDLLSIREAEAREIAQLKREKLEIQRRTLELAEREKRDRDILFYNSAIDPCLPSIQQEKLLEMKMEIKTRYNLDY
ncbi:retrotransposon protein, putative, ty3-gypsy subclass [Tanacetum coccineum]